MRRWYCQHHRTIDHPATAGVNVSAQQSAASKSHELDAAVTLTFPIRAFAFQGSVGAAVRLANSRTSQTL